MSINYNISKFPTQNICWQINLIYLLFFGQLCVFLSLSLFPSFYICVVNGSWTVLFCTKKSIVWISVVPVQYGIDTSFVMRDGVGDSVAFFCLISWLFFKVHFDLDQIVDGVNDKNSPFVADLNDSMQLILKLTVLLNWNENQPFSLFDDRNTSTNGKTKNFLRAFSHFKKSIFFERFHSKKKKKNPIGFALEYNIFSTECESKCRPFPLFSFSPCCIQQKCTWQCNENKNKIKFQLLTTLFMSSAALELKIECNWVIVMCDWRYSIETMKMGNFPHWLFSFGRMATTTTIDMYCYN